MPDGNHGQDQPAEARTYDDEQMEAHGQDCFRVGYAKGLDERQGDELASARFYHRRGVKRTVELVSGVLICFSLGMLWGIQ